MDSNLRATVTGDPTFQVVRSTTLSMLLLLRAIQSSATTALASDHHQSKFKLHKPLQINLIHAHMITIE